MLSRRDFGLNMAVGAGVLGLSPGMAKASGAAAMSLTVVYPNQENARFDTEYYREVHIPLAMDVMKASDVSLTEGVPLAGAAAPFRMIAQFRFPSAEAVQTALSDPRMTEVRADVARFTDIKPAVMLGRSI